jgi:hypothetical protein
VNFKAVRRYSCQTNRMVRDGLGNICKGGSSSSLESQQAGRSSQEHEGES